MKLASIEGQPRLYVRVARRIAELVAIAEATENAAITLAVQWLWTLRNQSVLSSGFHSRILEEGIYPAVDQHKEILDALKTRSADAARTAMRAHLIAATEAAAKHFGGES